MSPPKVFQDMRPSVFFFLLHKTTEMYPHSGSAPWPWSFQQQCREAGPLLGHEMPRPIPAPRGPGCSGRGWQGPEPWDCSASAGTFLAQPLAHTQSQDAVFGATCLYSCF